MIEPRVIRVFVSSTFKDMQAEREELVKRVFPQLRKLCESRYVTWGEVDLRWGITDEQKSEGKVLPICLEEIHRCQPYFIGLLGERYGWIPGAIPQELIDREPWLAEHRDHSVTELEILHGVLNDPRMEHHAFFYFRDPKYLDHLPAGSARNDFESESSALKSKLDDLKQRIRQTAFPVRENYPDPAALGKLVLEDLTKVINELYPESEQVDPLDRDAADHEAFAKSRAQIFIERREYSERLDEHAAGDGPPLVLLGESGVGKSALLANWALHYRERHPDEMVLMHFIGATPYSADWAQMLRRLLGELKRRFTIEAEIPGKPEDLRTAFLEWLHAAAHRGRVVLVLDALNQLEDKDAAPDLVWLPPVIPPNVRLIVSTLEGRPLEALKKRGWPTLDVKPMDVPERKALIKQFFGYYTKALSDAPTDRVANAPQTANPLYLTALLDELRQHGDHFTLGARIEHYLAATVIDDLYERILERYEHDYEGDRPGLVRDAMTALWAARRGLSEVELLDVLGSGGDPMPQAYWSALSFATDRALVTRSGLITFAHDYLRQAVHDRYLPNSEDQTAGHLRLADYFEPREMSPRRVDELPWQLSQVDHKERLKNCIANLDMFHALHTETLKYELMDYWRQVCDAYSMVEEYTRTLHELESGNRQGMQLSFHCNEVSEFFLACAQFEAAEALMRRAIEIDEQRYGPDHPEVATGLSNLAQALKAANDLAKAEPLMRRALTILERSYGPDHPKVGTCLNNLSRLLRVANRLVEAEPIARRAVSVFERIHGPNHPDVATGLSTLALLLHDTNRLAEAEPLYRRAIDIYERCYGPDHPDVATGLSHLAHLLNDSNRLAEAESLMRRALAIDERSLGPEHPHVAVRLNNLAELLSTTNRRAEAEPLIRRALSIDQKSYGPNHPNTAIRLGNLAVLLQDTNQLREAESLMRQALAIEEKSYGLDHPGVATTLDNLGKLLSDTNRQAEAEPLIRRALSIEEKSHGPDHPNVASTLNSLAHVLFATNRMAEAEASLRRALSLFERSYGFDHPKVALSLNGLAQVLRAANRLAECEALIRRALAINEKNYGPDHPSVAVCLGNLGTLLQSTNRLAEAEPLLRRALDVSEMSYGPDHPDVATGLNNLALLLKGTNRMAEAEPLMRRALAIDERIYGSDHPEVATGLNNLAQLLQDTNRLVEAEPLIRRALEIFEMNCEPEHPNVAICLNSLAELLCSTNRPMEAEPLLRRALDISEKSYGPNHPAVATCLGDLAQLLKHTNRMELAEPLMRRALDIDQRAYGPDHPTIGVDLNNLAALLHAMNRLAEAEPLMRRALQINEHSYGPEHPKVATCLNNLAALLATTNRPTEAEPLMRRTRDIFERTYGPDHPNVAVSLCVMARLLQTTNRLAEAEPLMRRHLEIFLKVTRATGRPHPHLEGAVANYAELLSQMGRSHEQILATLRELAPEFFR